MQRIQSAAGLLVHVDGIGATKFAGSCFSFRRHDVFLTAHHCIDGIEPSALKIGMPALGNALAGNFQVLAIHPHPSADVAMLFVDAPAPDYPYSMNAVDFAAGWGERVVTFGFPEDTSPGGTLPTARMCHGEVQRFFDYHDGRAAYRAIEVSFPAPQGLSGSPISRTKDTGMVIGVVAANHTALTYRGGFEVSDAAGPYRAVERDIVRYGIAVFLPEIIEWIDDTFCAAPLVA